jgi:hypothetical protein
MATSFVAVLQQHFDTLGDVLNGGKVYSYEAGTDTPLATYQDLAGATPNANPTILDAYGRATIRVTDGVAYKFVLKDADDNILRTEDNVIVGEAADDEDNDYEVATTYCGTPGAQGFMGACELVRSATFPVNFDGARGSVQTAPAAPFVISVEKNGVEVGTISIATTGVYTFATTGAATVACISGDTLAFFGPDSVGTAADFAITLVGDLP